MRFSQGPHSNPVAECRIEYKFGICCSLIFATLLPAKDADCSGIRIDFMILCHYFNGYFVSNIDVSFFFSELPSTQSLEDS